jgi:ATP-dependent DNA helicase DinG
MANGARPIWPLRAQGDAPRDALLTWFKETPHSVLLATRSFWEGVDIPGDDLSLVVLDKMPFPTPGDPLHSARMAAIDVGGGNSFGQYMTPLMNLSLKQGFGRLIRRTTDLGVVAILDERLTSKSYGRQARNDLPPARFSREFRDVHKFFQAALSSKAEFALNVWAEEEQSSQKSPWGKFQDTEDDEISPPDEAQSEIQNLKSKIRWRWQALRLQDGKADSQEGVAELPDAAAGEIHAAILGLQDLRGRIERAGRQASQFGVEVRCRQQAAQFAQANAENELVRRWISEQNQWQSVDMVTFGSST